MGRFLELHRRGASTSLSTAIAGGGSVTPVGDNISNAQGLWGFNRLSSGYSGSALKVERSSDGTTQDIGFNSDGTFDGDALDTFVGAGTARLHTWYDQSGNSVDLTQTTDATQPIIEQDSNDYWHIKCEGGDFVQNSSFMGTQTNSSWYLLYQWPSNGTISGAQGGIDFGASTEFAGPPWTKEQTHTTRAEASASFEGYSSRLWCDQKPNLWVYKGLDGTESHYVNGAESLTGHSQDGFAYSRVTIGKNDFASANMKVYGLGVWSKDVTHGDVWDYIKARFPSMWVQADPYAVLGDSLSTALYTGINNVWVNDVVVDQSIDFCHAFVRGGYRIQDWIDKYTNQCRTTFNNMTFSGTKRALVWLGTNDIATDGLTGAQAYARFETLRDLLIADGFSVVGMTQIARSSSSIDAERAAFNTLMKADTDLEDVVALDEVANLQDATDGTYFYVDQVHLTTAGQDEVKDAVNPILTAL